MESLIPLLESVKDLAPESFEERIKLVDLLYEAEKDNEKSNAKLVSLFKEIKKYPELSIFDNLMEVFGSGAVRVTYSFLISWLIKRTASKSAKVAVQDLKKFLSTDKIPFSKVNAISGLKLDKPCDLGNGIRLIPWESFPNSFQKESIFNQFMNTPYKLPSAALLEKKLIKRSHMHVPQDETNKYMEHYLFSELDNALLCVSLVGPVSSFSIAKWLQPPEWAPLMGSGFTMPFAEGLSKSNDWPAGGCDQAKKLYKAFLSLKDNERSKLKIPLERLNLAMRKWSLVDAAIDLGIALESIFLTDLGNDYGELTFRLKLRASRFLDNDLDSRKKLFKIFGNLYKLRSRAIHSGKLPKKLDNEPVQEILTQGFILTAKAITQIIFNGLPDWNEISLA